MTRFSWLRMTRRDSIVCRDGSRDRRTHYLEGRIALCANCECPRALSFGSGSLACSSCGSGNWIHPPSNLTTRFHQYRDAEAGTTTRVQPTVARPKKEEAFFAREVALV